MESTYNFYFGLKINIKLISKAWISSILDIEEVLERLNDIRTKNFMEKFTANYLCIENEKAHFIS